VNAASAMMRKAVDLRAGEGRAALLAAAYFFVLLFAYFMLRPLRDALGLQAGIEGLRVLFLASLGAMLVANVVYGAAAARVPRRLFVPGVYVVATLCLVGFLAAFLAAGDRPSAAVGAVFYVWLSVFNLFAVSVFWSFVADVFSRAQSKRLFGFIAVGGTAGAVCGSAWTGTLAGVLGPVGLFAGAAVLLLGAAWIAAALERRCSSVRGLDAEPRRSDGAPVGGTSWEGLARVVRSPYLLTIAGYVGLFTVLSTLLYFEKMRIVAGFTEDDAARASVLAWIEFAGQTATILIQLAVTGRLMKRFGAGVLLAVVPAVTVVGFVGLAAAPALLVVGAFEAARRACNFALSKPARETLFTELPAAEKYKAKGAIDTFVYRGGDAVGTVADKAVAALGVTAAVAAVPLSLIALGLAFHLGRRDRVRGETWGRGTPGSAADEGSSAGVEAGAASGSLGPGAPAGALAR